jgi:hypothetical protein
MKQLRDLTPALGKAEGRTRHHPGLRWAQRPDPDSSTLIGALGILSMIIRESR